MYFELSNSSATWTLWNREEKSTDQELPISQNLFSQISKIIYIKIIPITNFLDETDVFAAKSVSVMFYWNCQFGTALARYFIFRTIHGVIAFLHFRSDFWWLSDS